MMSPDERHVSLMIDEIELSPSLVYDPSTGRILGKPTLLLADGSIPEKRLARHGPVFMLG